MELGKHLVEELGHADRGTTLGRWMAHHLAALMREAEEASTDRARQTARKAAQKMIIELWSQRTTLPGAADPMSRYQRALTLIDQLSPDDFPWSRHAANTMHGTVAELNEAISKLLYSVILSETIHDVPPGQFEELALPFLDKVEQRVLHGFASILIKIVDPTGNEATSPKLSTDQRIAAVRATSLEQASRALEKLKAQIDKLPLRDDARAEDDTPS